MTARYFSLLFDMIPEKSSLWLQVDFI